MPDPVEPRVAVVIPAFQAAATVGDVVARARRALPGAPVIVVDDGSTDGTASTASAAGAQVVLHETNRGKGAALQTGLEAAAAHGATVVVTLDADGQHPPEEIPRLVEPIAQGQADLVLGARAQTRPMPVRRRLTNWISSRLASRIGGQRVSDAQTGFRAFAWTVTEFVRPTEARYEYETAFLLDALAFGFQVASVPIPTIYNGARSHFRSLADTWRVARVFTRHARRILLGGGGARLS